MKNIFYLLIILMLIITLNACVTVVNPYESNITSIDDILYNQLDLENGAMVGFIFGVSSIFLTAYIHKTFYDKSRQF